MSTDVIANLAKQFQKVDEQRRVTTPPAPPSTQVARLVKMEEEGELRNWGSPEIGEQWMKLRQMVGLGRRDMSRMTGVSESMISKIEQGHRGMSAGTLGRWITVIHEYAERTQPNRLIAVFEQVAKLSDTIAREYSGSGRGSNFRGHDRFRNEQVVRELMEKQQV